MSDKVAMGRYICYLLRHNPQSAGIRLDEHGYAKTDELINAVGKRYTISNEILDEIVKTDAKQRYSYDSDKKLIRANQGHSIAIDVQLETAVPPNILYHGTGEKSEASIVAEGLKKQSRLYVHLSVDIKTAVNVGKRHGKPVVFLVDTKQMKNDGFVFYLSKNGIWLVDNVPAKYLTKIYDSSIHDN